VEATLQILSMNLIKKIIIVAERGHPQQFLPLLSKPEHHQQKRITVICGRNRAGKSHLLEQLDVSVNLHNKSFEHGKPKGTATPSSRNISCELLKNSQPSAAIFYFREPAFMISQATVIRYRRDVSIFPRPEKNISLAILKLLSSHCEADIRNFNQKNGMPIRRIAFRRWKLIPPTEIFSE
jgi:predicted ATPase